MAFLGRTRGSFPPPPRRKIRDSDGGEIQAHSRQSSALDDQETEVKAKRGNPRKTRGNSWKNLMLCTARCAQHLHSEPGTNAGHLLGTDTHQYRKNNINYRIPIKGFCAKFCLGAFLQDFSCLEQICSLECDRDTEGVLHAMEL